MTERERLARLICEVQHRRLNWTLTWEQISEGWQAAYLAAADAVLADRANAPPPTDPPGLVLAADEVTAWDACYVEVKAALCAFMQHNPDAPALDADHMIRERRRRQG